MSNEELRALLAAETDGLDLTEDDAADLLDRLVAAVRAGLADGLTAADRRSLATLAGVDVGVSEGALELANVRTVLRQAGVPDRSGRGHPLTTIAMVEHLTAGLR